MQRTYQPEANDRPRVPSKMELKVSPYEQVASSLMAMLVMAGSVVGLLFLVWLGSKVTFTRAAVPVLPLIVDNEDGGFENGVLGESIELPGEVTGELGQGGPPKETGFLETVEMVTSVVSARKADLVDPSLSEETKWSTGGVGGSRGTGNAPALGLGGGSGGGVPRQMRWVIDFEEGKTLEAYARQLDFFKVEIGVIGGAAPIEYALNLAKQKPDKRSAPAKDENRLYFSWQKGALQQADRQLLTRAGINQAGKLVVQFYPPDTENLLANVEMNYLNGKYPGRSIKTVRQTRFNVRPEGKGYTFIVVNQSYLGG